MREIAFYPGDLFVAERGHGAHLEVEHVVQGYEMHATLIEAVPGFAVAIVIEELEIAGHAVVDGVVFARNRVHAIDMDFLQHLTRLTEFLGFRRDWLRTTFGRDPKELILDIAVGDSMEPGIRDGDALLIDTTDQTFRDFGIFVIEARGERLVKRVQRKFDGSLILISDNKLYHPELIPADLAKEVRVVGRGIWRGWLNITSSILPGSVVGRRRNFRATGQ